MMTKQNTRYEWEDGWQTNLSVSAVGLVLVNRDAVEGALFFGYALPPLGTIARADVLKDILGDAQAAYDEAVEAMGSDGRQEA